MSDYAPTTREVTAYYCHVRQEGTGVTAEEGAHERFHAEFDRWLAKRDAEVAEKAWDRCVGEMPIDPDWKNFYGDNNPYRQEGFGSSGT